MKCGLTSSLREPTDLFNDTSTCFLQDVSCAFYSTDELLLNSGVPPGTGRFHRTSQQHTISLSSRHRHIHGHISTREQRAKSIRVITAFFLLSFNFSFYIAIALLYYTIYDFGCCPNFRTSHISPTDLQLLENPHST